MTKDQARFLLSAAFPVLIGTCRTATCPTGFVQRLTDGSVLLTPYVTPVPANDVKPTDPTPIEAA